MSVYFGVSRNIELSTIDFLSSKISASWSGVTVTKTFTQATEKNLPVVCVRLSQITSERLEVGNTNLFNEYLIIVDIFGTSDGFSQDMAQFILDQIKTTWDYNLYSHQSGNKLIIVATPSGQKLKVMRFISNMKLEFGENVERKDRFRHSLSFSVKKL